MLRCPTCASEVPDGSRFCSHCATEISSVSSAPTATSFGDTPSRHASHPSLDGSRFVPGTMVAERYRIVGMIGKGGMGEVYRADDLVLGQPVALKFLPEKLEHDQARLHRFLGEIRIARQVAHSNVCRVYDVGEIEGRHFLSMEFVDGDDLSTLLRRVGRLPEERGTEIARQLCAGLAAAHDQGILHRDLKPANVMIDGRGRVKITDFGLAGYADTIEGTEIRAGTPTYMAPEQLSGKQVSVRSDLYSLGLVLYEVFTGRKAFEGKSPAEILKLQEETTPTAPSSLVDHMNPVVEQVVQRCLERDPTRRPASALSVAAALPGGDPLAAALAAGETPSPDMVAAAGPAGGLRSGIAVGLLAATFVGVVIAAVLAGRQAIYSRVTMEKSMEALKENARARVVSFGYDDPPVDSATWLNLDQGKIIRVAREKGVEAAWDELSLAGQQVLSVVYRQDDGTLMPTSPRGVVNWNDPLPSFGAVTVQLDLRGKLVYFKAVPSYYGDETEPAPSPDWTSLFDAAGLDITQFDSTTPTVRPKLFSDARMAWSGVLPDQQDLPVRIEAAAVRGRPVYFNMVTPDEWAWTGETQTAQQASNKAQLVLWITVISILATLAIGAVFLAVRNIRLGRGDRRGAFRLAGAILGLRILSWVFGGHHVADLGEVNIFAIVLGGGLSLALISWVAYMALEPYVRKLWPQVVVGWSRLLVGGFRDPLVGRDLLIGSAAGVGMTVYFGLVGWIGEILALIPPLPDNNFLLALQGGRHALGTLFTIGLVSLAVPMFHLVLLLLARIVLRRQWIAFVAYMLVNGFLVAAQFAAFAPSRAGWLIGALLGCINAAIFLFVLQRFGLLALVAALFVANLVVVYPLTTDFSAPYFPAALFGVLLALAVTVYGFRTATAGQQLIKDSILEEPPSRA
ncbi:MAG: protein kinase [Acidobacteriota bacterium]|nr:protein kinase [Acidobacteriota bacterium]MDH3784237.1 protein kinase [Acidobacteriota bacterium]